MVYRSFHVLSVFLVRRLGKQTRVVEGQLRCSELVKYIEDHKTRKIIWLSEDATAIIPTVKYDPRTNQLVGILQPIDKNGCPIPLRYSSFQFPWQLLILTNNC